VGLPALPATSGWRQPMQGLAASRCDCPSELNGQRNPLSVADQMTFAAQLGSVGWIRSRLQPPNYAWRLGDKAAQTHLKGCSRQLTIAD